MRKRKSVLLASTMTVVGLAAGVTPAHAAPKPLEAVGQAYMFKRFQGPGVPYIMQAGQKCSEIALPGQSRAYSAKNTGTSSTITLYSVILPLPGGPFCFDELAELGPGESDTGEQTELGEDGAIAYSST